MSSVLITGVSSGLGRALAAAFLEEGREVRALGRRPPAGLDGVRFVSCDLAEFDAVAPALGRALEGLESLDLAVLNAGVLGAIQDLRETSLHELREVLDVNLWANKLLIDALAGWGKPVSQVLGISSGASRNGSGGWGPYNISKAALNLMLRTYADELPGTHFTAVAPGVVRTPMIERILAQPDDPRHPAVARIKSIEGTERMLSPEEAAARLLRLLPRIRAAESGSYLDVREL